MSVVGSTVYECKNASLHRLLKDKHLVNYLCSEVKEVAHSLFISNIFQTINMQEK